MNQDTLLLQTNKLFDEVKASLQESRKKVESARLAAEKAQEENRALQAKLDQEIEGLINQLDAASIGFAKTLAR